MEKIKIVRLAVILAITIFVFILSISYLKNDDDKEKKLLLKFKLKASIDKRFHENTSCIGRYFMKLKLYLSQTGFNYMFGIVHPLQYIGIRALSGFVFLMFAFGIDVDVVISPVFFLAGYFLPDLILKMSNNQDNEKMMRDIKNIYETMKIQTGAGVFITTTLCECYKIVYNRRLKMALYELTQNISAKKDIETALGSMTIKFKNKYIDIFAMIISQSLSSGQSIQLLDDISTQLVDLEAAIMLKDKSKLDLKIQLIELMVIAGIIVTAVYALITSTSGSLGNI